MAQTLFDAERSLAGLSLLCEAQQCDTWITGAHLMLTFYKNDHPSLKTH